MRRVKEQVVECNSEDGVTVGLIDAIMTCAQVLKGRSKHSPGALMALLDLKHHIPLRELLCGELPLMDPVVGYTVGTLMEKLRRFPPDSPVVVSAEEDYSGPARVVTLEPQGMVVISDGG